VRFTGGRASGQFHDGIMAGSRTINFSRRDNVDWATVANTAEYAGGDDTLFENLYNGINIWLDTNPTT
jgi:hypothetical protein